MALSAGTQLGTFEITGKLGAGGMGEVYRATDSRLGREVAIKTLPSSLAADRDRLARFEREAKLLATLNHAHIAAVYSLDEHEGTRYLAMELVEGETLEEKLKQGALPVDVALQYGLQIAEALEAAHDKGVVHRDLKPANVMVTPDGVVKVLDFGLAKACSGDPDDASIAQSPALSLAMTQAGLVLGTAGYMSPEQASGQATDQRADIWAFGVVLYEMLTGMPLFSGESVPHVLADVLKTEPDWSRLPAGLHPRIRFLLERCLTKKPRNRYHSIADVRVDIEAVLGDPEGAALATAGATPATPPRSVLPRLAVAVAASFVIAGPGAWLAWPRPVERPINRFVYDVPGNLGYRRAGRPVLALSPDGRRFVLNTDSGLYLRRMGELDARLIPGTEEDMSIPFFSPDGQSVAYFAFAGNRLKRISISGGAPVPIAAGLDNPIGASWESDGTILVGQENGIVRVPAGGGTPELVIAAQEGERLHGPQLLPDGESVLFTAAQTTNWDTAEIVVASLATGERTVVFRGGSDARYLPTGHLVYAYEDDLFGVRLDLATLTVSGGPVSLVQGLTRAAGTSVNTPSANYGIAADGTLVYLSDVDFEGSGRTLAWVDRDGNETAVGMPPCLCTNVSLSPDGTRVAMMDLDVERADADIWIWSFEANTRTRVTFEPGFDQNAIWSPDSRRIIYFAVGQGILSRAADGTGTVERLLDEPPEETQPFGLDQNGNVLFVTNGQDIDVLDVAGDGGRMPLIASDFTESGLALSPDGRWLAYESNETGKPEVYVRAYPDVDSGGKWQVSENGGAQPRWSPDGGRLYFLGPTQMMESEVETEPTFRRHAPVALFATDAYFTVVPPSYDVSADEQRFLMMKRAGSADTRREQAPRVVIVQNWLDELARLVPTD